MCGYGQAPVAWPLVGVEYRTSANIFPGPIIAAYELRIAIMSPGGRLRFGERYPRRPKSAPGSFTTGTLINPYRSGAT